MDIRDLRTRVNQLVWEQDLARLPTWRRFLLRVLRIGEVVARDLSRGQLNLQAMSLVYTTLLSIVPLLAVSFSVLKAFGVHNQIEPLLENLVAPMGEQGQEVVVRLLQFVDNMRVGVLGALGLGFLFYTVVALMQKIERAFNYAWYVKEHRSFAARFSDYLSVLIVGPVLVFSALGLTASIMNTSLMQGIAAIEPFGTLIGLATKLTPFLLIIAAFTFVYMFIPNTRVKVGAALVGAVVAGVLWQTTGLVFASMIVGSTNYTAIYSAFATLILFMIWLYLTWLILLVGASIAFYYQNPNYVTPEREDQSLSPRMREKIALLVMHWVGRHFYEERPAWTIQALADRLHMPQDPLSDVLQGLESRGLLCRSSDQPPLLLPGRPLDTTSVEEVLEAVRETGEGKALAWKRLPAETQVDDLIGALGRSRGDAVGELTLKDLALGGTGEVEKEKHVSNL